MNNAILANIELSDTYLVNSKVNTNTTKTPKGVKKQENSICSRNSLSIFKTSEYIKHTCPVNLSMFIIISVI